MPKAARAKYYAVKVGREGRALYGSWDQCKLNVTRFPGAVHKSFASLQQAKDWLMESLDGQTSPYIDRIVNPAPTQAVGRQENEFKPKIKPLSQTPKAGPQGSNGGSTSAAVTLSKGQLLVLEKVKRKENVFFTGSAGTGKSVLLREIIRVLGGSVSSTLGITASTGIAAVNIGGATLHSWAGVGLGQEPAEKFSKKVIYQPRLFSKLLERWREVKTLIIDEVSLIDGEFFDKLEKIARLLRNNVLPFGGIQLVVSGDFCQLPPVVQSTGSQAQLIKKEVQFAFEAKSWERCLGQPVMLTQVFRQKDQAFVDMLNALRLGEVDPHIIEAFRGLSRPVTYTDGIDATALFATRVEVENANCTHLANLPGDALTFLARDTPGHDGKGNALSHEQMERLLQRLVAPRTISLKVGAQVMLIKNMVQGKLVNGSVGKVTDFRTLGQALENRTGVPEIEDKQGSQNPCAEELKTSDALWPLVQFTDGQEILCVPTEFTVNNPDGGVEARRSQVPLILAWALSIHKSQGQTLERVKVDLGRIFERGQAYVALSRATNMQSLQVLGFHPRKVQAHPRVLAWYNRHTDLRDLTDDDEMYDEDII